jgi:hypothetical protein
MAAAPLQLIHAICMQGQHVLVEAGMALELTHLDCTFMLLARSQACTTLSAKVQIPGILMQFAGMLEVLCRFG